MPNPANQGFMNNPGVVLTQAGVVVVDPGGSRQVGEMLLKKIAGMTQEPVIAVFNTHIHGDHWLANEAIRKAYPKAVIYAHPKMIAAAGSAGESWVNLMDRLTEGATRGTKPVAPDMGVEDGETLKLGGIGFRFYHTGKAHTDSDIAIEVVEEKVVFLGDIVVAKRAGRMDDGDFRGNLAIIDTVLGSSQAVRYVPGHGETGGREVAEAYRDYINALLAAVKKYYEQGMSDFEMKDKVLADLAPYKDWAMFDSEMGKLISLAYLSVESESF
jgi:glyoxylase-like metal-dependent hydrolase (beta-lactamase superfamily II)